ncbi:MAG: YgjV family protein [Flavobacteriaceae bacterium]|nr:YgjV family protein [Flavobacteriaceae bacterium]
MEILGMTMTELVGYLAMITLLISFMMKEMKTLRIVNGIGCAVWVLYGFMLQIAWPVVITNILIICINFYYLFFNKKQ